MPSGKNTAVAEERFIRTSSGTSIVARRCTLARVIVVSSSALVFGLFDAGSFTGSLKVFASPAGLAAGDVFDLMIPIENALSFQINSGSGQVVIEVA